MDNFVWILMAVLAVAGVLCQSDEKAESHTSPLLANISSSLEAEAVDVSPSSDLTTNSSLSNDFIAVTTNGISTENNGSASESPLDDDKMSNDSANDTQRAQPAEDNVKNTSALTADVIPNSPIKSSSGSGNYSSEMKEEDEKHMDGFTFQPPMSVSNPPSKTSTKKRSINSISTTSINDEYVTTVPQTEAINISRSSTDSPEASFSLFESSSVDSINGSEIPTETHDGESDSHEFVTNRETEQANTSSRHPEFLREQENFSSSHQPFEFHSEHFDESASEQEAESILIKTGGNSEREFEIDEPLNSVARVDEPSGATFDPDGMTHTGPQDPDAVIFSTPRYLPEGHFDTDGMTHSGHQEPNSNVFSTPRGALEHDGVVSESTKISEKETNHNDHLPSNRTWEFEEGGDSDEELSTPEEAIQYASNTSKLQHVFLNPDASGASVMSELLRGNESLVPKVQSHAADVSEEMLQDSPHIFLEDFNQSTHSPRSMPSEKSTKDIHSKISSTIPVDLTNHVSGSSADIRTTLRPLISTEPKSETSYPYKLFLESNSTSLSNMPESTSPDHTTEAFVPKNVPFSVSFENLRPSTKMSTISATSELATVIAPNTTRDSDVQVNSTASTKASVTVSVSTSEHGTQSLVNHTGYFSSDSTEVPLVLDSATTTEAFKIRRPKVKIPGVFDPSDASSTQRPAYIPPWRKPSTSEPGPPVSIFKKQRVRIASITSSTTARPLPKFNNNVKFATIPPDLLPKEFLASAASVETTSTEPPTTTTEEPISEVPFTDTTHVPTIGHASSADTRLVRVAGTVVLDRGLHWEEPLANRHSPQFRHKAELLHTHLERLFRSSSIAPRIWKLEIEGFSGIKNPRAVAVDFFLFLIKSSDEIDAGHLATVLHERLSSNNTFYTFRVDTSKTLFERVREEPLLAPTLPPETEEAEEQAIPQWAIAVIVVGAASLVFILLFAAVTVYGRQVSRRRYASKLSEEEGDWESKMAAAYENMAADTVYDASDLPYPAELPYKKGGRLATFHGRPSTLQRSDSWSSWDNDRPRRHRRP